MTEEPRRRRGCLTFGCLIPLVLVVGLGVAGFFAARAFVRDRLDQWRADAPLVDLAVTVLRLRDASNASAGPLEAIRGDQDPASLPDDVVVVDGSEPVVNITSDAVVVYQETDDPPDVLEGRLREALVEEGWTPGAESDVPGGREFVWSSPARTCVYQVVEGVVATAEVWIRCVAAEPGG